MAFPHKYTPEQKEFMKAFVPGHSHKEIMEAFNHKFETDIKVGQVKSYIGNNKLNTGRTGSFPKGHVPANKGKKGIGGWPETHFKKGHMPYNYLPVGTELKKCDGYVYVKIADPNKWKQKHIIIWEAANGAVPDKHRIIFADGDRSNVCLENLLMVTRRELLVMNRGKLIKKDKELTKTGLLVANIIIKTNDLKGKRNEKR